MDVCGAAVGYFIGDAAAYYQDLHDVLLNRSGKSAKAAELARQLAAAKTADRLEAVTAIRDFVAKSIRDAGPVVHRTAVGGTVGRRHHAGGRIRPHGGPRHSAACHADGRRVPAGIRAGLGPAADRGHHQRRAELPLPHNFSAVLVRVAVDGQTYYLNDTDEYAHLGATAYDGRLAVDPATRTFGR